MERKRKRVGGKDVGERSNAGEGRDKGMKGEEVEE